MLIFPLVKTERIKGATDNHYDLTSFFGEYRNGIIIYGFA